MIWRVKHRPPSFTHAPSKGEVAWLEHGGPHTCKIEKLCRAGRRQEFYTHTTAQIERERRGHSNSNRKEEKPQVLCEPPVNGGMACGGCSLSHIIACRLQSFLCRGGLDEATPSRCGRKLGHRQRTNTCFNSFTRSSLTRTGDASGQTNGKHNDDHHSL